MLRICPTTVVGTWCPNDVLQTQRQRQNMQQHHDSTPEYSRLRDTLQRLQSAPIPDKQAISKVIDDLEQLQLRIKTEQTGIKGNNQNE